MQSCSDVAAHVRYLGVFGSFITHQETAMKFHPKFAHETRERSCVNAFAKWHRQALAAGTAALLTLLSAAPAWAAPRAALPAARVAAKVGGPAPAAPSTAGGCQLNSPRGQITHVVTIIFDNTHFKRDPLRDGSTPVPSQP